MTARRFGMATVTSAIGYAVAAALFWTLLNVPESNVLALTVSAALGLAVLATVGATTAATAAVTDGASAGNATRRSVSALPAFIVGLAIMGALWWLTGAISGWWLAHRGETDALFIRYMNVTRTRALHDAVALALWTVRWVVGLSTVAALVTTAAVRPAAGLRGGIRNAVAVTSLATTLVIAGLLARAWPIVYWRPARLAPWLEPTFVSLKLALLYAAASAVVASGIAVMRRVAAARSPEAVRSTP